MVLQLLPLGVGAIGVNYERSLGGLDYVVIPYTVVSIRFLPVIFRLSGGLHRFDWYHMICRGTAVRLFETEGIGAMH